MSWGIIAVFHLKLHIKYRSLYAHIKCLNEIYHSVLKTLSIPLVPLVLLIRIFQETPKTWAVAIAIGSFPDLECKSLFLKTPFISYTGSRKSQNHLTWKPFPQWLAFSVLEVSMKTSKRGKQQYSYLASTTLNQTAIIMAWLP